MSSIFKYASNAAALAVGYGVNAYDRASPKVASAAIAAKAMSDQASYTAKTAVMSTLPTRQFAFMQLKKSDVKELADRLNETRPALTAMMEASPRPVELICETNRVRAQILTALDSSKAALSEAQKVFRNDSLKLAGKAALVVGAAVVAGLVVKALHNYFTQPVKTEDKAPVQAGPVSPAASTEPASPAESI